MKTFAGWLLIGVVTGFIQKANAQASYDLRSPDKALGGSSERSMQANDV